MLEQFLHHIEQNNLCKRSDKILLTVSGGLDSMVMLYLFKQAGFSIGVAHCNFQLRGEESKGDEDLVKKVCADAGIPFHSKHFETEVYAEGKGVSIQMAARELRYTFFNELVNEKGYQYIATAHHLNDNLETVLLNLVRGTGMDGVTGIPVKHQNVIRPLLIASREIILEYATSNSLSWREDSSNASDKYHRNLLRNQVVPLLKKINPGLEHGFHNSLQRLKGSAALAYQSLQQFKSEAVTETVDRINIDKNKLNGQTSPPVILWELIKNKGFNFDQCCEAIETNHQPGKVFYSDAFQLTVDRVTYIISLIKIVTDKEIVIDTRLSIAQRENQRLTFEVIDKSKFSIDKDPVIGQFDFNTLRFPLTWRTWRPGDRFIPLGMSLQKKLSDFFIDVKVSLPDKNAITVLESAGEIIWIVGYRINDRFKVTEETSLILCVSLHSA
jgi:tRNA(Ile)-lysidine synthase